MVYKVSCILISSIVQTTQSGHLGPNVEIIHIQQDVYTEPPRDVIIGISPGDNRQVSESGFAGTAWPP